MGNHIVKKCSDCSVSPGELHHHGCDRDVCPRCGDQSIACGCVYEVTGVKYDSVEPSEEMWEKFDAQWEKKRIPWSGETVGLAECREYGFWCVGPPWVRVPVGTEGAKEDINHLYRTCLWNQDQQKWIRA